MAAQNLNTWDASVKIAAHEAVLTVLDQPESAGTVTLHTSSDVLLATIPLTYPGGSVDQLTGVLTLTPAGRDDNADVSGTASYASLRTALGQVLISLPCNAGTTPVAGQCIVSNLSIMSGRPVELVSFTVG